MTTLLNPALFSKKFEVPKAKLSSAGLIDPVLNCDTKLFLDPLLIGTSSNSVIRTKGNKLLRDRFANIIRLVAVSEKSNDVAWKAAANLLNLEERPETCIGYGGSGTGVAQDLTRYVRKYCIQPKRS